ncbi:MAG: M48 family metalloprotease [Rhodospirillales bacterium]|nr:M48 family metalloprotease [Rhodospirillales bacterium]
MFTGFLAATQSDDEIAFVLGHELGHSLLKHNERRESDTGMQLAKLAVLIGALSKGKTGNEIGEFGEVFGAQYSQQDEAEADALGASIALRAGFDPLRGADFFTRTVKERDKAAPGATLTEAELQAMRVQLTQMQNACVQWTNAWNTGQIAKTQQNADQTNKICADAESKRVSFNKANAEFYNAKAQESLQKLSGSHPASQSRVAALAGTVDFLAGRRDVESLAKYESAYLVMRALQTADSVLLQPADVARAADASDKAAPPPSNDELTARLAKLKAAFDSGLITKEEYDSKRKELLAQL